MKYLRLLLDYIKDYLSGNKWGQPLWASHHQSYTGSVIHHHKYGVMINNQELKYKPGDKVLIPVWGDMHLVEVLNYDTSCHKYKLRWPAGGTFYAREEELSLT